jgi:hypothetical protein
MNSENSDKLEGRKLVLLIFECVMAVLYPLVGILFLFTSWADYMIAGTIRIVLGVLFGLYGIFRIYRAIKKLRQ